MKLLDRLLVQVVRAAGYELIPRWRLDHLWLATHLRELFTRLAIDCVLDVGANRVLDETLTREEALVAHTRANAYLFFQENALGSLEVGKQADLVVLDRDYMTVPVAEIKHIRPALTMVGGRVVFSAAK